MELIFMGTGTSQGVPVIGPNPPELDLDDPRNWRTRASAHVVMDGLHIQIDAAQEFRLQCLWNRIAQVDRFILTHGHADHILGMDDLRRFCELNGNAALPVFASDEGAERIRQIYPYAMGDRPKVQGYPAFQVEVMPEQVELAEGTLWSTPLPHASIEVLGLLFEERSSGRKLAYFTDCKEVSPRARELAAGADVLVLDALRPLPHPSHLSIDEAVTNARELQIPQTYFTHLTALLDHETWNRKLPPGMALAHDGLRIQI